MSDEYADLSRLPLDVAAAVRWAFGQCEATASAFAATFTNMATGLANNLPGTVAEHVWAEAAKSADQIATSIAADLEARDGRK